MKEAKRMTVYECLDVCATTGRALRINDGNITFEEDKEERLWRMYARITRR